jgi:peptide/nickel transport system substrate-binding protein
VTKPEINKYQLEEVHPAIPDAYDKLQDGRITRQEFLRFSTLLGMSATVAQFLASCGSPAEEVVMPATEEEVTPPASAIKRGGSLVTGMLLQLLDHPARLSWIQGANIVRQICEYLTLTGPDNLTRPYLLEKWEANDDVTEWDLYLQKGIKFNNGDELTADDVMFTFGEWLNPEVGSSMLGLLAYLSGMQDVEKVDDYHIKLHLQFGEIAVPEHLFHYPASIMHREFEGDIIKKPVGTGAFTLEEYAEGERASFKRREDYWQMGEDGQPLPYLGELVYVSIDKDAGLAALQSGQIDAFYDPRPTDFLALQGVEGVVIRPASTAQCLLGRMRVDLEPWDDVRVRNALKMCQDRAKILQLAYFGEGDLSLDAHVAPVHPAYCERPIPDYDPEGAKKLLDEYAAEKSFDLPLKVTLTTKNDQAEPEIAQALKELAEPVGFEITLDITDPTGYWDRWTEVDLGITSWTHRPLATMVLPLAYTEESIGAWNETRWTDTEFEEVLREAQGTLDVEARRGLMCQIEDIMQERGPIFNSFWKNVWNAIRSEFQNVKAHPTQYDLLYDVWKD